MSEQKYKAEIEKLTSQLKTEKNINESLKTKIRVRGQELGFRSEELVANAIEMVRMTERIRDLEITHATEREKELESELKISQLARNELQKEFENIQSLYEESQIRAFFFQITFEFDTTLTVDQFDKKIKRFFKMLSDLYPLDNQKRLDEGKRAWKLSMIYIHPDKNSNDPCAGEKFKAFNQAYENFTK